MTTITPHRLKVAPFSDSNLFELGYRRNWPELRRIVTQLTGPGFAVVDGWGQSVVDDARRRFDSATGGDPQLNVLHTLLSCCSFDTEGVGFLVEQLLSIGMDPDLSSAHGWRPTHICAAEGCLRAGRAIFLCRPDMKATNPHGHNPRAAASMTNQYPGDDKSPHRQAGRQDLSEFISNEKLEEGYKTLSELAVRQVWFAIMNLVRRQVIPASEYQEKTFGKTADEWAEYFGKSRIAEEIRYYASLPSAKLLDADAKFNKFEEQMIYRMIGLVAEKDAAIAKAKAESDALRNQMKDLEERCATYEKKNVELFGTIAPSTSHHGQTPGEVAEEPPVKRTKMETADLGAGERGR